MDSIKMICLNAEFVRRVVYCLLEIRLN